MNDLIKLVPNLRFPAFIQDGEWKEYKFGDIAQFYKGKGISKNDITDNGTIPCIRYGELYTHYKEVIDEVTSYTDLSIDDLFMSKANDIIIPSSGETKEDIATASCVLRNNVALGGDINVIRTSNNGVFLSYYLNNAKKHDIAKIAQGISIIHLYNEQLRNLSVEIPNLEEQQKIAECLSTIDSYISSINEKVEQLKAHKKSLLQKLFPKNGKNVPDYRFPEFEKDGVWGEKCFGDCLDYEQPQLYLVSGDNYKKEGTPVLTAGKTFVLGFTDESYGIYRQLPVIIFDDFTTASRYVNFPFKAKSSAMKMLQNKDGYDLKFMFEALQNYKYEPKEHQRHWISIFQNFKTLVPSYSEQRKIAECLFSIDKIIEYYSEKASQLVQHKKGIMQQLFPINR